MQSSREPPQCRPAVERPLFKDPAPSFIEPSAQFSTRSYESSRAWSIQVLAHASRLMACETAPLAASPQTTLARVPAAFHHTNAAIGEFRMTVSQAFGVM